jgi:hypothetical protein
MKNKPLIIMFAIIASSFFYCLSSLSCSRPLNAKMLNLAYDAVFEIVLEKPADEQIEYEEEINWEFVPFHIRTDKYDSIGTAFAISRTELMTAFHVMEGDHEKYYVRDSRKNIYEVDTVTGGSKEKDYLIFTVKGKTFNKIFKFERKYNIGDPVFSIGNALGEGIVVRDGLVLGEVPEEDSGRWNELKTSVGSNPGNSGGPIVTPNGKVIALLTAHKDNIVYSTPVDAILNDDRSIFLYREKERYYHFLLANRLRNVFETQVSLPGTYTNLNRLFRESYNKHYDDSMSVLFEKAPEYINGTDNDYLLHGLRNSQTTYLSSNDLYISYVDSDDDNWKLYNPAYYTYNLDDDGMLYQREYSNVYFYKIKKPKSVSLEKICTDPKYIMDTILQNIRTERKIWYDKYRILSYGEPVSTGLFRDSLGRTWITANWKIGFEDNVLIMYILPLPDGPFIMTTKQDNDFFHEYNWDLQKSCDHLFTVYGADFDEWGDFFALTQYIPDFLKNMRFNWNSKEQVFSLNCDNLSISADKRVFDWNNKSELYLFPFWYKQNNKPEFGIRKVVLCGDQRGKENIIIYLNTKPGTILGTSYADNWNDLILGKFPFNGIPVISIRDNNGFMGSIIKAKQPDPDICFSLYLKMEAPQSEGDISRRFNAFKKGVFIEK